MDSDDEFEDANDDVMDDEDIFGAGSGARYVHVDKFRFRSPVRYPYLSEKGGLLLLLTIVLALSQVAHASEGLVIECTLPTISEVQDTQESNCFHYGGLLAD